MIEQANFKVKSGSAFTTVCPFPIGYIYMSANNTSPASIYGGTWQALTDDRFLLPSNSWNLLGGNDWHSHSAGGMRALIGAVDSDTGTIGYRAVNAVDDYIYNMRVYGTSGQSGYYNNVNHSTLVVGQSDNASNIPTYRTCYCWYRSA